MSYSFWNVYRWELELGGGGQLDYYSHPKWVLCLLLSENILLAFLLTSSTICPWTLQLIAISISLSLFVLTTLWVMRHLASSIVYCLACSDVSLRDVCVCVFLAKWNWEFFEGGDKYVSCFILYWMMEIRNGGTEWKLYWSWSQIIWINFSRAIWPWTRHWNFGLLLSHLENENISTYAIVMKSKWVNMCANTSTWQTHKNCINVKNVFVFTLKIM